MLRGGGGKKYAWEDEEKRASTVRVKISFEFVGSRNRVRTVWNLDYETVHSSLEPLHFVTQS